MATSAVSDDVLYVRTLSHLVALAQTPPNEGTMTENAAQGRASRPHHAGE